MILSNQVRCLKCDDTPFSAHRHDYKQCKCGAIAVDGGLAYIRRVGDLKAYEDMSISLPEEACQKAIFVAEDALEGGTDAEELAGAIIKALMSKGAIYGYPKRLGGYQDVENATIAGAQWAIDNKRNGLGAVCAIARYVRDAGGVWASDV